MKKRKKREKSVEIQKKWPFLRKKNPTTFSIIKMEKLKKKCDWEKKICQKNAKIWKKMEKIGKKWKKLEIFGKKVKKVEKKSVPRCMKQLSKMAQKKSLKKK